MVAKEGVGTITLARPDRKNALDREAADDITQAVSQLDANNEVRVIVVRAEGKDFCAGADLHALRAMIHEPLEVHEADARALGNAFLSFHACNKPTISLVQGKAFAGGAALATGCDIVLARGDALFSYPEVALGFVPAMAMAHLVRSVGEIRAFELVATGRRIGAQEAHAIGLVSRWYAEENFGGECEAVIASVAAASTSALVATKKLLHDLRGLSVQQGIEAGAKANARARLTEDFRNGVIPFADRRKG